MDAFKIFISQIHFSSTVVSFDGLSCRSLLVNFAVHCSCDTKKFRSD